MRGAFLSLYLPHHCSGCSLAFALVGLKICPAQPEQLKFIQASVWEQIIELSEMWPSLKVFLRVWDLGLRVGLLRVFTCV